MGVPEGLRPLLDELVELLRQRFQERVRAVYLIGSLAHGDWSARLGDLDVAVVLADPPGEGDGPALVAIAGEIAERFPRFGPRLSLFWATEAILGGDGSGARLGPLDVADLAQNGVLLHGEDVRGSIRRLSREDLVAAMHADMCERWKLRVAPFAARDALESGRGAELDERALLKITIFPARFLAAAASGRLGSQERACAEFAAAHDGTPAEAVALAAALRQRPQEATPGERGRLAAAVPPLYALFFAELGRRHGLEPPRG